MSIGVLLHVWHGEASRKAVLEMAERVVAVALEAVLEPAGLVVTQRGACAHRYGDRWQDRAGAGGGGAAVFQRGRCEGRWWWQTLHALVVRGSRGLAPHHEGY